MCKVEKSPLSKFHSDFCKTLFIPILSTLSQFYPDCLTKLNLSKFYQDFVKNSLYPGIIVNHSKSNVKFD